MRDRRRTVWGTANAEVTIGEGIDTCAADIRTLESALIGALLLWIWCYNIDAKRRVEISGWMVSKSKALRLLDMCCVHDGRRGCSRGP